MSKTKDRGDVLRRTLEVADALRQMRYGTIEHITEQTHGDLGERTIRRYVDTLVDFGIVEVRPARFCTKYVQAGRRRDVYHWVGWPL